MKKIIFIHYGGTIGGAPMSMLDFASFIDKNIYDVMIVFTSNGPMVNIAKSKGFNTKVINFKSVFFYGRHIKFSLTMVFKFLWNYFATIKLMDKLIVDEKPSLVYLNTSILVTCAIALRKKKIPFIWSIREVPGSNTYIRKWQIKKIEKLSNHIIVTSKYVMNYFNKLENISVLHNSVDIQDFNLNKSFYFKKIRNDFHIENDCIVLCQIGSIQVAKGHFLLIEAIKEVLKKYNNFKVLIIAGGVNDEYRSSLKGRIKKALNLPYDNLDRFKKLIDDNNLKKYFIFSGYRDDIPKILCSTDIVLFPSLMPEGFGRPIIEGMASGIPVIASDIGPSREILGDKSGILLKKINTKELADAILTLLTKSKLRKNFGESGLNRVSIEFDSNKMKKKFNKIIENRF